MFVFSFYRKELCVDFLRQLHAIMEKSTLESIAIDVLVGWLVGWLVSKIEFVV